MSKIEIAKHRDTDGFTRLIDAECRSTIATLYGPDREANARLFAAAPEMMEALKSLVSYDGDVFHNDDLERAEKALAKARGE